MCMLDHRVQIILDEDRYRKVVAEAQRRHMSIGAVVRESFDQLPANLARRRAVIGAILAAEPMPVPRDPAELRRELDAAHDTLER
jgi:hypothetical protein